MHTGKRVLVSVCWLVLTGQLLHFVQKLAEQVQSGPDGLGRGHIHAGPTEQVDGVLAASAGQEAQVVLHRGGALLQDAAGEGDGGGVAGGVLEHIVVVVEVGDPGPLQGDLVVDDHVGAEVVLIQRPVLPAEEVGGEGLALGGQLTDAQLEFGEHGLAVQGPLNCSRKWLSSQARRRRSWVL